MSSIRAARTVSLVAVVGAPLSSALLDSFVRWNQPASATGRGAVGDEPWG
jgi:hypothetical protein